MVEQELLQNEKPVDTVFRVGSFFVEHQGRELRVECVEMRGKNSNRSLFSVACFEVSQADDEHVKSPISGAIGISKQVALFALSDVIRNSILREITRVRNTSSPGGDGTL